jgi:glucokinase
MTHERGSVGIDVGGTKVAALRVAPGGEVLARAETPTPVEDGSLVVEAMKRVAREVLTPDVSVIGMGVAGLIDAAGGVVRYSPNLPLRDVPLTSLLGAGLGLPCVLDNDANTAAWAEYRMGAGRGSTDMLFVGVGTGIGGAIVSGGRLVRGAHGFAGEIGHIIVEPGGPVCGCGNRGCWEQMASGRAIDRLGRAAAALHPESALMTLAAGDASVVDGRMVTEAARSGDRAALGVLAEVGRRLGEGMAGLVNVLDPDLVVVGGGATAAGELLLEPARRAMAEAIEGPAYRPSVPLVAATAGNEAGAVGAALLALDETTA